MEHSFSISSCMVNHAKGRQPFFFLYYHLVGIFPRCYPLEWDAVWGRQRSWHIEHHRWFGRGPEQCPSRRSGLTSIVWEVDEAICRTSRFVSQRISDSVNGCGGSLASCWATVFEPRPSTAPHRSPSPRCCAPGSQLPWCRARKFQINTGPGGSGPSNLRPL